MRRPFSSLVCSWSENRRYAVRKIPKNQIAKTSDDTQWMTKAAEVRLARMQTITSAGTRTALTWLAFLLILWLQSIEPKLKDADQLKLRKQNIDNALSTFSITSPESSSRGKIYAELNARNDSLGGDVQKSRDEPIDLPFGIKLKSIPSTYVPLLWNLLFIGLLIYLLSVRRKATELAAQSVRLLQYAAKVPEEQLYDVSAGTSWWIAPLPSDKGYVVLGSDLRRALGWSRRWKTAFATVIGIFLIAAAVDARIIYAQEKNRCNT